MANVQARKNKKGEIISYSIRVFRGRDINGKQLKPYCTTWYVPNGMSPKKIQSELNKFVVLFEKQCKDGFVADNKQSFQKYAEYVINLKEQMGNVKHRTLVRYKELLTRINPAIGHLKLDEIRPQHLNMFYEQLSKNGINKNTGGKLSSKTILEHHRLIRTILTQAEKEMLVLFNAAAKATPPKQIKTEANYFELEDIKNILYYVEQEPLKWQLAMNLLVFTGCRRGEIMGLKWNKVDFNNSQITIDTNLLYSTDRGIYTDTPKTEKSKRTITLNSTVMELFKKYKKEQTVRRVKLGTYWNNTGFIFTQENGNPMHPDTLTDYCKKFENKYNNIIQKYNNDKKDEDKKKLLPHINPHAFRHTQASLLIQNGTDISSISARLGHSKISTTTDIYNHMLEQADKKVANTLDSLILNSQDNNSKKVSF